MEEFQGIAAPSNSNLGFQVGWHTSAKCLASLLSIEEAHLLSLAIFCYLGSFSGTTSPSSTISFSFLFFFKLGIESSPTVRGGGGGGRVGGGWDLEASLGPNPLALRRSRNPFFLLSNSISSYSSEPLSTHVTMGLGEWATKDLSSLSSESGS